MAHDFVFFHLPWQAAAFRASVQEFTELAEQSAWPAWFLENHDHSRVAARYAAAPESGQRRARTAAMLICTLRGTPFLYHGQELGLPDAHIPPDRVTLNFGSHRVPLALGDDAPGPAFLELSTHSGREHGPVDLRDLVLEPDEGLILRLSEGGAGRG